MIEVRAGKRFNAGYLNTLALKVLPIQIDPSRDRTQFPVADLSKILSANAPSPIKRNTLPIQQVDEGKYIRLQLQLCLGHKVHSFQCFGDTCGHPYLYLRQKRIVPRMCRENRQHVVIKTAFQL